MGNIYHFEKVSDLLACSGQPTESQLKQLAEEKYQIVVNLGLLETKYALTGEAAIVESLRMEYFHFPVVFEHPQISELVDFINYMNNHAGKKMLVHCAANYRASAFVGLYLLSKSELTEEEMHDFIDDVWQPNTVWQSFIEEGIDYLQQQSGKTRST